MTEHPGTTAADLCGQPLGPAADVLEGGARGYPAAAVFAVRRGGRLYAYRDACPHYGDTPLAWRRDAYLDAGATQIVCASHGARFEIETGLCVLGPCLGRSLTPVAVAVDGRGQIVLTTPTKDTP